MGCVLFWGWWDGVRVGTDPCEPDCGVSPGPPDDGCDQQYSAAGWRVLYRGSFGPTRADAHAVGWDMEYRGSNGRNRAVEVTFEDSAAPSSLSDLLTLVGNREAPGYREVFRIPNAGLGVYDGAGVAMEKVQSKPGLPPTATGFFILGVPRGDHAVVGWSRGLREPGSGFNGHHYDPSRSIAAQMLAMYASGFELLDKKGQPVYG